MRGPGGQVLLGLGLVALTVAVFWRSLQGDFIWGDDLYITQNVLVQERGAGGLKDMWLSVRESAEPGRKLPQYYPLTFTTFWLEWRLWENDTRPYHLANILLHGLGAVLLWRLLRRLDVPGAWFAAAIFAIHPIHVDSVTWISERVNTLSGVFFMASFLLYWRHEERRAWPGYALSLLMFVLALLSKTAVVVLPAMLVLVRWWKRRPWTAADIVRLVPYFALSAVFALITIGYETEEVGAKWDATLLERCLLASRIAWFYFLKLLWPMELLWVYPRWEIDAGDWSAWLPLIGLIALVGVLAAAWKKTRAPLAAVGCFLAGLFPVMGFFDIYYFRYSFVADHFNYLPAMVVIALLVGTVAAGLRRVEPQRAGLAGAAVGALVIAGLSVLTWRHQPDYFSTEQLYRHTLAGNPGSAMPRTNLGVMMAQRARSREDLDKAIEQYQKALEHNPRWDDALTNWGDALASLGRLDEAAEKFREAIEINPKSHQAYNNLGTIYADQRRPEEAIAQYRKALEIQPRYPEAHNNLAAALAALGQNDEAIAHYRKAVELRPGYVRARYRMALLLGRLGRRDEAIAELLRCVAESPGHAEAHKELGVLYADEGNLESAEKHLAEWSRLRPGDAQAREAVAQIRVMRGTTESAAPPSDPETLKKVDELYTQGSVLTGQGRFQEAAPLLAEVVRLDPTHAGAYNNLGIALSGLGRREDAVAYLREAVRLKPDFAEARTNLGAALVAGGQAEAALPHCTEAVRLNPNHPEARHYLAEALSASGRTAEAAEQYREALRLRPGWAVAASALAWILATSPDEAVRSGAEAVYLAEEVCRVPSQQVPSTLDTLAAAYAETGRFEEAAEMAAKAMKQAQDAGQPELANEIETRWKLYQQRQPYRENSEFKSQNSK